LGDCVGFLQMSIPNFTSGWPTEYKAASVLYLWLCGECRELLYCLTIFIQKVILKGIELADLLKQDICIFHGGKSSVPWRWTIQVINERRAYQTYFECLQSIG
jgi:hypothetical protein